MFDKKRIKGASRFYYPVGDDWVSKYLHQDGVIRPTCINNETGKDTGWFNSRKELEDLIDKLNAKENNVKFTQNSNTLVCWVNSESKPHRINRLGVYDYNGDRENPVFNELCEYHYYDDREDIRINHKLLIWETIEVPVHKRLSLIYKLTELKYWQEIN